MSATVTVNAPSDIEFSEIQRADENTVYEVMQAFLKEILPMKKSELVIVRGQGNRVAMPKPPLIILQFTNQNVLSLNESRYTDRYKIISSVKEIELQLDFYGTDKVSAQKMADIFVTFFNDGWAFEFFGQYTKVVHPLYTNTSHNVPFISGEDSYNSRYTVIAYCAYQPEMGVSQQSAKEIKLQMGHV